MERPQNNAVLSLEDETVKPELIKPVTVKIEDFRKNLNQVVAESQLPPFLLEMVLGEMLTGIGNVARKEYAQDREEWEKAKKARETMEESCVSAKATLNNTELSEINAATEINAVIETNAATEVNAANMSKATQGQEILEETYKEGGEDGGH